LNGHQKKCDFYGIMDLWNIGVMIVKPTSSFTSFYHSNIALLQHSNTPDKKELKSLMQNPILNFC